MLFACKNSKGKVYPQYKIYEFDNLFSLKLPLNFDLSSEMASFYLVKKDSVEVNRLNGGLKNQNVFLLDDIANSSIEDDTLKSYSVITVNKRDLTIRKNKGYDLWEDEDFIKSLTDLSISAREDMQLLSKPTTKKLIINGNKALNVFFDVNFMSLFNAHCNTYHFVNDNIHITISFLYRDESKQEDVCNKIANSFNFI